MTLILLALLGADAATAGAEYTRGLSLLRDGNYPEAAAAFEEAIRNQPTENPSYKYRDPNGRHSHPYYPHLRLAQARLAQAKAASSPYDQRERLREAVVAFEQTVHPKGVARLQKTRVELATLDERIRKLEASKPSPEVERLRAKVEQLSEARDFEAAFREIESGTAILQRYQQVRDEMLTRVRNQQGAALRNYDVILSSRLDSISRTDPTYESAIVLPLLKPARVPPEVSKSPAPRFRWLDEFYGLYENELEHVRNSANLQSPELLASSEAFEQAAAKALAIDLVPGFRAARNMAHAMRLARLKQLATAAEKPGSDLPGSDDFQNATEALIKVADETLSKIEEELKKRAADEALPAGHPILNYVQTDVPYQKRQLDAVRGKIRELTIAYERRVSATAVAGRAEESLFAPDVMGDPNACRSLVKPLNVLEAQPYFETLSPSIRARMFFARAVCLSMSIFLEGGANSRVVQQCRSDVVKAFALDENVDARWTETGRLSPRIERLFESIRE